jgi:glycosyltransferase involved in cell wall biosynthesis
MPRVSVVMPVYNAAQFVKESVSSVSKQTFRDFELIVIDDGSTDESPGILDDFATRDPRIRVTHRANKGVTVTRNELIAASSGEFMAVLDADDVSCPHRLERQVAYLDAAADVVCLGGWWEVIDQKGRMLTQLKPPVENDAMQNLALQGHSPMCHSATMMRLDAVRKAGGYDPQYAQAEDLDLYLKLGEIGRLANIPEVVVKYRLHSKSMSELAGEVQRACALRVCEQAWARRGIQGHFDAAAPWRAGSDRASRFHYAEKYGWWAFNSGERRTAMIYGLKSVAALPWKSGGWKLFAAAAIKKPPKRS